VAKDNQVSAGPAGRRWLRRVGIALGVCLGLLVIFHRPLLQALVKEIVLHSASQERLKITFNLEGNVFTSMGVRNLHVSPIGASDVESIDADLIRVDYSLWRLMRHGLSDFVNDVQIRSARVVLNPVKSPPKAIPKAKKPSLPTLFPALIKLSDVSVVIRNRPHDFFLQHVDLELDPRTPGRLRIGRLQLPDGQTWAELTGATSYANKNLIIRDLQLNEHDHIDLLGIDASQINKKKLEVKIDSRIGGGRISGSVNWFRLGSSFSQKVELHAQDVSADALNKYANLRREFLRGQIDNVDVDLIGKSNSPSTWQGMVTASLRDFHLGAFWFDRGMMSVRAKDGTAVLEVAKIVQSENQIKLEGSAQLPDTMGKLGQAPAQLQISSVALDLAKFTSETTHPLSGSANLNGKIEIKNGKLQVNLSASADSVGFDNGAIEKVTADFRAARPMPAPGAAKPWFADLRAAMNFEASKIHYRDQIFDSVDGSLSAVDDIVTINVLNLYRQENNLAVSGHYRLPAEFNEATASPADLNVVLKAKEMGDYWASDSANKVTGPLQITAQIDWKDRVANGQLSIFGSNLKARELTFNQLSAQGSIWNNVIYINDFTASLNQTDFVAANGAADLRPPFRYSGKLSANISNVAALQPLLRAFGNETEVAGSLAIDWEGNGLANKFQESGKLKVRFENGRFGDLRSLQSNIDASYSPDGLEVPMFFLSSDRMNFHTIVQAKGESLEVTKIELNQGQSRYASGYISIPFIWKNLGTKAPAAPPNGKITATFQSENIDIKKLFEDFGAKAPVTGMLNIKLDASGTMADLNGRLDLQMRDLHSERAAKLEPATFDLSAQVEHDQLTVNGRLQQRQIQPLDINAKMPLDISKISRERKVPDQTPITAKIHLPRSSVNFLRQIVPELEILDGDLAMDVDVNGKFGRPILSGNADMTINFARFTNTTLPALRDFKARLVFANETLTLERFNGELAGGQFTVNGKVTFPTLTSANLDLRLKADSVLIARNDTMTARSDADVNVAGPLTSASVTGSVALTNSRFLKNIDLIPIGLPGRPAPQPPSAEPEFSFPQPPLRDWKFDVAIKTKDPVLIRGNLATGNAIVDLKLNGTGLRPGLSGVVRLNNVEATLPFSRLAVSYGFLYFDPSDSLNPKIDLHGTSIIQDYTVRVYVYGTILAPEAIFTSEPPLPQEEIISLLATGSTREGLTGSNNALAGRAAMLLVQQLYRKIFKKGETTQSNTVFDRLDLDVGQVDPRTGQRQATARFRVNDQFLVVGDVEVGGDFRLKVRYLLRFH